MGASERSSSFRATVASLRCLGGHHRFCLTLTGCGGGAAVGGSISLFDDNAADEEESTAVGCSTPCTVGSVVSSFFSRVLLPWQCRVCRLSCRHLAVPTLLRGSSSTRHVGTLLFLLYLSPVLPQLGRRGKRTGIRLMGVHLIFPCNISRPVHLIFPCSI